MTIPYRVAPDSDLSQFTPIQPQFPNWQKSFVSGPGSPLYQVSHLIHQTRKTLLLTKVKFLDQAEGPPGHVHGGATAGLLDEVMGIVVWHQNDKCVTQTLELSYLKMLPLNEEALIFTDIVANEEKTIVVNSTVYSIAGGKAKTPHVSAQGVFHRLSAEQLARLKVKIK